MKLPVKNKNYFYKNGVRYVNKYKDEWIYIAVNNSTIHDYHRKNTLSREGIVIFWNYKLFEYEN